MRKWKERKEERDRFLTSNIHTQQHSCFVSASWTVSDHQFCLVNHGRPWKHKTRTCYPPTHTLTHIHTHTHTHKHKDTYELSVKITFSHCTHCLFFLWNEQKIDAEKKTRERERESLEGNKGTDHRVRMMRSKVPTVKQVQWLKCNEWWVADELKLSRALGFELSLCLFFFSWPS